MRGDRKITTAEAATRPAVKARARAGEAGHAAVGGWRHGLNQCREGSRAGRMESWQALGSGGAAVDQPDGDSDE
jgi:hypothetical protein